MRPHVDPSTVLHTATITVTIQRKVTDAPGSGCKSRRARGTREPWRRWRRSVGGGQSMRRVKTGSRKHSCRRGGVRLRAAGVVACGAAGWSARHHAGRVERGLRRRHGQVVGWHRGGAGGQEVVGQIHVEPDREGGAGQEGRWAGGAGGQAEVSGGGSRQGALPPLHRASTPDGQLRHLRHHTAHALHLVDDGQDVVSELCSYSFGEGGVGS